MLKTTRRTMLAGAIAATAFTGLSIQPAMAEFPDKAIEFIIPFGAGGGAETKLLG